MKALFQLVPLIFSTFQVLAPVATRDFIMQVQFTPLNILNGPFDA